MPNRLPIQIPALRRLAWSLMLLAGGALTGCHRIPANARHIAVVMKRYAFEPAEIHVRRGEVVVLDVTATDTQHGFKAAALDIDGSVQRGHTTQIVIQAWEPGVYPLVCSVVCGPHHNEMTGKLVVE